MKTSKKIYLSQATLAIPDDKILVFWDTCALLDIIRIPYRDNLKINDLKCYEKIADYIDNGYIISVTSGLVISELDDHYDNEINSLRQIQEKLKGQVVRYSEFMISTNKKERINKAINLLNIESRLNNVLNRILKNTVILKEQNKYRNFADYRLRNKMAPAAKKAEYKDCYIWGTYVELIHTIKPKSPIVAFMTVNTKDYTVENGELHNHIKTDCNYLSSMQVSMNIGELYGKLHDALGI